MEESDDLFVKKPTRSKFAVLLEDNQSDQSEGNDERPQSSPDKPTQSKKRNKKKNKKMADQIDDEDALLEKAINEVRLAKHEDRNEEESKSTCVLKVDRNQLDPEAELRNLLEKNMDKSGSRKIAKQTRNARTIGRVIKLKSGWPIVKNTGLILDVHKVENGISWFRINHSDSYKAQQYLFTTMRKNLDYEGIMEIILAENPYHLESLLLLSQHFIVQEEPNKAFDTIERALFAIENASLKFNLLSSEHQFEYKWRDNRVMFNLLWHQIQILVARHCFSTALQYAKILYGKSPADDPLAITLSLDMIALKGKNYQFLVDFYEQFASKRNLDMLPNFLYSTAYAYNCLFEKSGDEMYLYKSTELIHKAYTRFPFVLSQILSELSIDPGPAMSKEAMFQGVDRETEGIKMLVKIFLHHTRSFWKQPEKLAWLESTSTDFISNLTKEIRAEAKQWKEKRAKIFIGLPLSIKRHLILSGLPIDDGEVHDSFDPYPPANSEAAYWPEKRLEEEMKQLSSNAQNVRSEGTGILGHAWQFVQSIWPQSNTAPAEFPEYNPADFVDEQVANAVEERNNIVGEQAVTDTEEEVNDFRPSTSAPQNPSPPGE